MSSEQSKRLHPALQQPGHYSFHIELPTRFGDLDIRGHINNVSIAQYCEDARIAFQMQTVGREMYSRVTPERAVVAQMTLHFISEGFFPDPVDAGVGVARIGNSSYSLVVGLFQNSRCIAVQESALVLIGAQGPMALTAEIRARMEQYRLPTVP
jgi:acyl-CoA thioester hydrolase